ncbi:MAG: type II toxin-antitoxin system VapC family toxin [Chloroflexota bacterium]|nr:type II toxin-antitoxin system VapC family toxin [Chloroflexota bacterium]
MICIDSSVVVKLVVNEKFSIQAQALYEAILHAGQSIVAPPLLMMEVTNVLLKKTRRSDPLTREEAAHLLEIVLSMGIALHSPPMLHQVAFAIAADYQMKAAYDAYYLALSDYFECPFWTADEKLIKNLRGRLPFVRWIGDFPI